MAAIVTRADKGAALTHAEMDQNLVNLNAAVLTDTERTKLTGVEAGANAYTHPATHPPSIIAQDASNRFMTDAERTKLTLSLYHRSNILGSVSQSAGVPTGAVIERGSNANGEYVRFADGTQICTSPLITVPGTGWNATGLGFKYSNGIYNTLPANFVTAPVILVQIRDGVVAGRSSWLTYSDATTGATTAYLACVSASVETLNLQIAITTIGRWF